MTSPRILKPGLRLGDFLVGTPLGEGASGIVYDGAFCGSTERNFPAKVALKVLHPHLEHEKQLRVRFFREMKILAGLDSPHLCRVWDFGACADPEDGGRELLYSALDLIDGVTLRERLLRQGPQVASDAIRLVQQVCDALMTAHECGVIHRDLKPDNILVRRDDSVVVVDFGMAKVVGADLTRTTNLTGTNLVFGTPEYMAPEQAMGEELDGRVDVYATGAILYELMTGVVPFTGKSPIQILSRVVAEPAVPPRVRAPERNIPEALDAVIRHAMSRDPNLRYASAHGLGRALRQAALTPERPDLVEPEVFGTAIAQADAHSSTMPQMPAMRSVPISAVVKEPLRDSTKPAPRRMRPAVAIALWGVGFVLAVALGAFLALR